MYRSCNALTRALLGLTAALVCAALLGGRANADDGATPPRAVPAARSLPRSFSSYDDLVSYATAVAADQSALDQRASDTRAQYDATVATLAEMKPTRGHGGALFDVEAHRQAATLALTLSVQALTLSQTQQQLTVAGALTAAATPWRMPTDGRITQPFGPTKLRLEAPRVWNGVSYAHFHDGEDIAGAWAADVVAPARGRVVFVGRMGDGAEVVVLAHDGGIVTLYAHLDNYQHPPPVSAGDEVTAGQKIGTVGLTGITTGEHLHWAAWRAGALIDPMTLLGK